MSISSLYVEDGHDDGDCFWFVPVNVKIPDNANKLNDEDIFEFDDEVSICEDAMHSFLYYFFLKYFDGEAPANKYRVDWVDEDGTIGYVEGFEWYLTHNFYTYQAMKQILKEIDEAADLLARDYDDPQLNGIKERFELWLLLDEDESYTHFPKEEENEEIRKRVDVIIDYY